MVISKYKYEKGNNFKIKKWNSSINAGYVQSKYVANNVDMSSLRGP